MSMVMGKSADAFIVGFRMKRVQWLHTQQMQQISTNNTRPTMKMNPRMKIHHDVVKWKDFPRYWPFVRGIHRSPVISPHKGQWRRALMFSLIYGWINGWVNNRKAGDLRRHRGHYDVTVMEMCHPLCITTERINIVSVWDEFSFYVWTIYSVFHEWIFYWRNALPRLS